ncbi:hypothetical protein BDV93DRAFT_525154 [Ceratobasidium sp. AG-I]|nr:hypothetical protein BDV93DRAFT_525154 [Ceratobasidium sp. AG-I]
MKPISPRLILLLTLTLSWAQLVVGWGFAILSTTFAEGATGSFQITNNDGGGYSFPYTMTVFKQVPNTSDEQVGIVYANETSFYWTCNQPAGSNIKFRLMSSANVNAATSRYYLVQPGAQATVSSISTMSVASTAKQGQTASSAEPTSTGGPAASPKGVPTGVIVGAIIGAVMLLLLLLVIVVRVYRLRRSKPIHEETAQPDSVTPFTYGPSHLPSAPLMGYVSHSNINEEPPVYSPPGAQSTGYPGSVSYPSSSSYSDPYEVTYRGHAAHRIDVVPPPRSGKSTLAPVSTRPL